MSGFKITILLATFNRAHLIEETLISIQNQTYTNFECLITDDNSIDNTHEVVVSFCKKDNRFEYHKKTTAYPQGLSATRNFGLDLAQARGAQFIQFFDDDDIMHPNKLELQIIPLLEDSNLDLSICQYRKFKRKSTIEFELSKADDFLCHIDYQDLLKSFYLNQLNLNSPGPLWRSNKILKYRFDQDLFYAEERELYLRIFLLEKLKYKPVKLVLFWYRKHSAAITSDLYNDSSIKARSEALFTNKFLNLVLKQEAAPFFILKSYTSIAVKGNNYSHLKIIKRYIRKKGIISNPKLQALFLFIETKLLLKKNLSLKC